jgi:6-phosphofructokinase 1
VSDKGIVGSLPVCSHRSAPEMSAASSNGAARSSAALAHRSSNEDVRRGALTHLEQQGIEALAIIGGNGSQAGAQALSEMGVPVVGIASIDTDLCGVDLTDRSIPR